MLVEAAAEGFVGAAHVAVDAVEDGEFDEGIDEDEPRNPNGDEKAGVEGDGAQLKVRTFVHFMRGRLPARKVSTSSGGRLRP